MSKLFEIDPIGSFDIASHACRCEACRRLSVLNSYSTTLFVKLLNIPLFPLKKLRVLDECARCGNRAVVSRKKYQKERKRNLALMMEGFASDADDPDNCAHALHTLMIYDMDVWFHDVRKEYGMRFETNPGIQHLIARGLCRFGAYHKAMTYCRKALVLGAGKQARELLDYCQYLLNSTEGAENLEAQKIPPESSRTAYIPLITAVTLAIAGVLIVGVSSMRNYKAWVVNGSLEAYSFTLDEETYELQPGRCMMIKLRLGDHSLKMENLPDCHFTYSVPLAKQFLTGHMLVINPDSLAFLTFANLFGDAAATDEAYSYEGQIRMFERQSNVIRTLRTVDEEWKEQDGISLYRPGSHAEMVELLRRLDRHEAAAAYARRVLVLNPATDESDELLRIALDEAPDREVLDFLRSVLMQRPALLSWHQYYQNYMMIHHPEYNLEREYTLQCRNHPEEPLGYYLLARVMKDRNSAYSLFEHADRNSGLGGQGYIAIAHDLYIRGRFAEALPYALKAEALTESSDYHALHELILLALGDYDPLLSDIRSREEQIPKSDFAKKMVLYLTGAGYHKEAGEQITAFSNQRIAEPFELNAIRFYTVGNIDDYIRSLADTGNPHADIEANLHAGRIAAADRLVSTNEDHPYWEHLVVYSAAVQQGHQTIAERNLEKAIAEVGTDTKSHFDIAGLLSGNAEITVDAVRELDIDAQEKAVLAVALGYRIPAMQLSLNNLALHYNFMPAYPQRLLNKWIRQNAGSETDSG